MITPKNNFNAREDAAALRAAMKGLGTDEQTLIDILTKRTNLERQEIRKAYNAEYGRDIIEDIKSEVHGKFEDVLVSLMFSVDELLCKELQNAMEGMGTDENTLVEILCTKTNEQMKSLVQTYEQIYGRPLAERLCSDTSGHFRRLLTLIICGSRECSGILDEEKAKQDAADLYNAGEGRLGTNEETFNRIFAHSNFAQLRLIFEEYKNLTGVTIEQALNNEFDGHMLDAMNAIVECVQSPAAFFANRLHKSLDGAGTDDPTLIRILVSRADIDLQTIKNEYERIYNKTLISDIQSDTSRKYQKVLTSLIGEV